MNEKQASVKKYIYTVCIMLHAKAKNKKCGNHLLVTINNCQVLQETKKDIGNVLYTACFNKYDI